MRTEVTAAPGSELRSTRLSAFPSVMPKPDSNGAAMTRAKSSLLSSTSIWGSKDGCSSVGGAGTPPWYT